MLDRARTGRLSLAFMVALLWVPAARAQPLTSVAPVAGRPPADASSTEGTTALYGTALRARWVSVPHWLLSLFLDGSKPLSSVGLGIELFRRKGNLDIVLGLSYQSMSPEDGNWLVRGGTPALDTDLVQFRSFRLLGADLSFIWRTRLNRYLGLRYGAGLGLALLPGEILRVSNAGCTPDNLGNTRQCRPSYCPAQGCSEADHLAHEGQVDLGPAQPHRSAISSVPGAFPIVNVLVGAEVHVPRIKGMELRVEGGFYDAFFVGVSGAYLF